MAANSSGLVGEFLYDTPYTLTRSLILSLDADRGWELLAGEVGYSFDKIKIFELEYQRHNGSPTKALLWDLGSRNTTLRELYLKLQKVNRVREMKIIERYLENANESNISNKGKVYDSLPSNSSMQSLPLDLKISGLPKPPPPKRSNEVNFNHPFTQPAKLAGETSDKEKLLQDKVIPGFKQDSNSSGKVLSSNSMRQPQQSSERLPSESSLPIKSVSLSDASSQSSKSTNLSDSNLNQNSSDRTSFLNASQATSLNSIQNVNDMKVFNSMKSILTADNMNFDAAMAVMSTPVFTYKELAQATDGFDDSRKLGEGAFGKVYYGVLRSSKCAIKRLEEDITEDVHSKRPQQMRSELSALLRYRHENIVTLYGYALDGPSLCLVYQFMVNGSLEDRLQCKDNSPPLSWEKRIRIALGAAQGLQYFHNIGEKPLIHGDIKSPNILLDYHFEAKIGDLGQAQQATGGSLTGKFTHITRKGCSSKIYGTKAYFAPEVMRGNEMSVKSDVYAFGVVLLEICSGEKAFDERREPNKFIASHFSEVTDTCPEETWQNVFQDKKGGPCEDDIVIKMLQCAMDCIAQTKKKRPDMSMVVTRLELVETRWRDIHGSGLPNGSWVSAQCEQISHQSGPASSAANLTANPESHNIQLNKQKERPSVIIPNTCIPAEKKHPSVAEGNRESLLLQQMYDQQNKDNSPPVTSPQTGSPGIGGLNISLPAGSPIPDSIKLQIKFDLKQEGQDSREIARKIDLMEKENSLSYVTDSNCSYASDPQKIAKIQEFDKALRKQNPEIQTSQNSVNIDVPRTDPAKLAAMKMFDAKNSLTSGLHSDSSKLRDIEEFDNKNVENSSEINCNKLSNRTDHINTDENLQKNDCDFPSCNLFESPQRVQTIQSKSLPVISSEQVVYRQNLKGNSLDPVCRESEGFSISKSVLEMVDSMSVNENSEQCVTVDGQDVDMNDFFERYKQESAQSDFTEEEEGEEEGEEEPDSYVCDQSCTSLQAAED